MTPTEFTVCVSSVCSEQAGYVENPALSIRERMCAICDYVIAKPGAPEKAKADAATLKAYCESLPS